MAENPVTWVYPVLAIDHVHDGDTAMGVEQDLGFHEAAVRTCRLLGINAPEVGKPGWEAAQQRLAQLLDLSQHKVVVRTHRLGDFGRDLCTFWSDGVNVNQALLDEGLVVPYRRS